MGFSQRKVSHRHFLVTMINIFPHGRGLNISDLSEERSHTLIFHIRWHHHSPQDTPSDELFIHHQGTLIVCRSGANNKIWRQTDNTHRAIDFVTRAVTYVTKGMFEVSARVLVFSECMEMVCNGGMCAFKKKTKIETYIFCLICQLVTRAWCTTFEHFLRLMKQQCLYYLRIRSG